MRLTLIPEGRARGSQLYCEFDGLALELRPEDLSQAGVFVITTLPPALDRELDLYLRSPIGEIAVRGQVVQVIARERAFTERRHPGFGVLFVDLADDQRAWIGLSLAAVERAAAPSTPATAPTRAAPRAPLSDAQVEQQRKLAARRQQTLDELERDFAALHGKAPWAVLGLPPDAAPGDVRRAYLTVSKRYHPHVYAHLDSPEVSRLATELFIAHKRAYTTLCSARPAALEPSNPEPALELQLPAAPRTPAVSARAPFSVIDPPLAARVGASVEPGAARAACGASLRPSRRAARQNASPVPPHAAAPAVSAVPAAATAKRRTADAEIALSCALKHLAASRFDDAAEELERALALCPTLRDASVWLHVCRARRYRAGGRSDQAAQEYRALLELDPEHREALEQLGGRSRRRAGLIGKLFGGENE